MDTEKTGKATLGCPKEMKTQMITILVLLACGCAIHTSRHFGKTVALRVGEKTSFGEGHRTFVQVFHIDETHHRATVELWRGDFREKVWIESGTFAQTALWGTKVIELLSLDDGKAQLHLQWAENR